MTTDVRPLRMATAALIAAGILCVIALHAFADDHRDRDWRHDDHFRRDHDRHWHSGAVYVAPEPPAVYVPPAMVYAPPPPPPVIGLGFNVWLH